MAPRLYVLTPPVGVAVEDVAVSLGETLAVVVVAAVLLRLAAGLPKGAATAGREEVGTITDAQLAEIAKVKLPDLNTDDLEAAKLQVAGTARSMGISVAR